MKSIKLVLFYLILYSLLVNCSKKDAITEAELKSTNTLGDADYQISDFLTPK